MTSRIIVPEYIIEKIRKVGQKDDEESRAFGKVMRGEFKTRIGTMFGLYNEIDDSITITEEFLLATISGKGSLKDFASMFLSTIPKMMYIGAKFNKYKRDLKKDRKTPARIHYKITPFEDWGNVDYGFMQDYLKMGVKTAAILYKTRTDAFEAVGENKNKIGIITEKGKIVE